ncbi:MAG: hypothetical protein US25_C0085G0003 [Candidatus Moranbacteria bacterium GW2011_GWE1_36_7]|nr:MAG: hypothetical protein US25_C0085G0003 [Candidatus Moranbacteria bacterium GW2011_GWE1_36_7]
MKASADAAFDNDEFEEATKGGAKKSAESDAERKAREESEAKEKADAEDEAEKDRNEKEKIKRHEHIEKLFSFYNRIIVANHPNEIFGAPDKTKDIKTQLKALKRSWLRFSSEYNPDKYNSHLTSHPFPVEINKIASNARLILDLLYAEAVDRISKPNFSKSQGNREKEQIRLGANIKSDITSAWAAEEAFWNSKKPGGKAEGDTEDESSKKAEEETEEKTADASEKTEEEKMKNDGKQGEQENTNENANDNSHDGDNEKNQDQDSDNQKKQEEGERNEGRGAENEEHGSAKDEIIKERVEAIKNLRQELDVSRKEYLETDYKKNKAWNRLGKFFGNIGKAEREKNLENDQDIAWYRAHYDNKLFDLQNLLIEDARERGVSDDELVSLYAEFRTEQKIKLAEEHDQTKIEQQDGKTRAFVGQKMQQISDKYKSLPISKKIAIGIVFAGAALTAGQIGAGAVAAVATAATARRVIMGMITGVGVTLGLEKIGKKKDKANVENDRVLFIEKLAGMNNEEKYAFLSDSIKNVTIKDEENTIDKIKNQDVRQLATGVMVGTFLASGIAGDLIKTGFHKVAGIFGYSDAIEHATNSQKHDFSVGNNADTTSSGLKPIDYEKYAAGGKPPVSAQDVVPGTNSAEVVANVSKKAAESLTIEKGSSIEKTLIDHIRKIHPEMKNPGAAAHRMWLDYMHDNKDQIIAKVGDNEYAKMLKDGMVNVKPGTTMIIDEHNPLKFELKDISGKISHLDGHHSVGAHNSILTAGQEIGNAGPEITSNVLPTISSEAAENAPWNGEVLENQNATVEQIEKQYGDVLNATGDSGVLDSNGVDEKVLRNALEGAKKNLAEISSNPDGSYGRMLRNVLKAFSDKDILEWNRIEKLEAVRMLIPEGSPELGSLSQNARATMRAYGELVPPKKGELVGKWVVRFMQAARDGAIRR